MIAIALIALGMGVIRWMVVGPSILDLLFSRVMEHDTVYAPGYTEDRWNALTRGMTYTEPWYKFRRCSLRVRSRS